MSYSVNIVYRKGVENSNADGLSRQAWTEKEEGIEDEADNRSLDLAAVYLSEGDCGVSHKGGGERMKDRMGEPVKHISYSYMSCSSLVELRFQCVAICV